MSSAVIQPGNFTPPGAEAPTRLQGILKVSNAATHGEQAMRAVAEKAADNPLHAAKEKKSVRFCGRVKVRIADNIDRKTDRSLKLSLLNRAYRREMDEQAKKNNLPFAAGHHDFKSGPHEYDHQLAMAEYAKL